MFGPLHGSLGVLALPRADIPVPPPAFSPLTLPNLALWLDAMQIDPSDLYGGSYISTWRDQSGQGNDAINGYYVGLAQVDGKPVARFDGNYNGFTFANALTPYPLYIAMMVRTTGNDGDVCMFTTYEGYDGGFAVGVRDSGRTLKFYTQYDDPQYAGNSFQTDTFVIAEALHDGSNKYLYAGGNNLLYYGAEPCPLAYGSNPAYTTSLGYLAFPGGQGQAFNGDIAEVIVCAAAPDDSTRNAVRAYLAAKWQQ